MKTIYVDEMFFLNLLINYFILIATAKLCSLQLKRVQFCVAASFGSLYSVLLLIPNLGFLASPIMKLSLGAVMTLIAFGYTRRLLRVFTAFLAVSATFGGAVFAAQMISGKNPGNSLYIEISFKILVLSFALSYFVLTYLFRYIKNKKKREILNITVELGGKSVSFNALNDTGNELIDPISGQEIMIADIEALKELLPNGSTEALKRGVTDFLIFLMDSGIKFRLVPYSTINSKSAILPVFTPDRVLVNGSAKKLLLLGLTVQRFSEDEFSAVL